MNIDSTLALIPFRVAQKSIPAIDQKEITHFKYNYSREKSLTTTQGYRKNRTGIGISPYGIARDASVIKGKLIDIFA